MLPPYPCAGFLVMEMRANPSAYMQGQTIYGCGGMRLAARDPNCTSDGAADENKDSGGAFIACMITSSGLCLSPVDGN